MQQTRTIYEMRGSKPIEVAELLNQINKKDITRITMDELNDVFKYYIRLNVVYVNNDN